MTTRTPAIGAVELESSQTNKYITINDMCLKIIGATQQELHVTSSSSTIVLTDNESTSYSFYKIDGASGDFTLEFSSFMYSAVQSERTCTVWNNTAYKMTIHVTGGGNTLAVPANDRVILHIGTDTKLRVLASNSFDIPAFWRGTIAGVDQEMIRFVCTRPFVLPSAMVGSKFSCGTNPAATAVFKLKWNGSPAGTISVNTSGVATFSLVGAWPFVIGDILTVTTPNPNDAAIADIALNLHVLHMETNP